MVNKEQNISSEDDVNLGKSLCGTNSKILNIFFYTRVIYEWFPQMNMQIWKCKIHTEFAGEICKRILAKSMQIFFSSLA